MKMKTNYTLSVLLFLLLGACSTPPTKRVPSTSNQAPEYGAIFEKVREVLIPSPGQVLQSSVKKIPESSIVGYLQQHPESLQFTKEQLIAELEAQKFGEPDPTKHTRLLPPPGQPGYSDLKIYVNHPYYDGSKLKAKSNMITAWKNFILQAQHEIILNVFDFDLEEVAEALIHQAKKGLSVRVGIDKKSVIDLRPEVKKVADMLTAGGVKVTGVMPVGLNHQKITAIDWNHPELASVLFSSGNLTRSCLEPEGDLKGTVPLPKESVPNANHLLTMKSWILANLVEHELTKTLDEKYLLRGSKYPLNGSYQVTGPGVDPETFEAYPEPSITITFSPGGGLKNINKNLIAQTIKREKGSIRMLQFAYSSSAVDEALRFRAEQDYQQTKKFDFQSVGDTPFAMREWSRFLIMSGMKLTITPEPNKTKTYEDDPAGAWYTSLGKDKIKDIRKKVYVAPKIYGNNTTKVAGKSVKVNAKIHHKIIATPNFAILGTSFNFSEGAESNNEQILVIRDRKLSKIVSGMVKYMVKSSPGTVANEALRRNKFQVKDDEEVSPEDGQVTPKPIQE